VARAFDRPPRLWLNYGSPAGLVAQLVEQRTENPRVGGSTPSQATNPKGPTVETFTATPQVRLKGPLAARLCQFCSTSPLAALSGDLVVAYIIDAVAIRQILEHLDLSPPEKPPPDIRDVVRVPVDDEGREIEVQTA
jgi:hypothetical protein